MWRDAVTQTRAMLLTVTGSNLLTMNEMKSLRAELDQIVAQADPGTSLRELAYVWDLMGDRAEFLFSDSRSASGDRHRRPTILPSYAANQLVPVITPLESIVPPNVDPQAWRDAVNQTREMLLTVTESNRLTVRKMGYLRADLEQVVARVLAHPESAVNELAVLWNDKTDRAAPPSKERRLPGENQSPRPSILSPRSNSVGDAPLAPAPARHPIDLIREHIPTVLPYSS